MEDKYKVTAPQSLAGKMPNKADTKVIEIDDKIPPGVTPRGNTSSSSKGQTFTSKLITTAHEIKDIHIYLL